MDIRDRIKEFKRIRASEILDHEGNWRTHPHAQKEALQGMLKQVGIAGALTAYYSERNGGKLTLIDGHLRKTAADVEWPALVLDVTDAEADLLLATLDPLAAMAGQDAGKLVELLAHLESDSVGLRELLTDLERSAREDAADPTEGAETETGRGGPPEMELQPFEHFDYVMLVFKNQLDWLQAVDAFGVERKGFTLADGKKRKMALCRVIDGAAALAKLKGAQASENRHSVKRQK